MDTIRNVAVENFVGKVGKAGFGFVSSVAHWQWEQGEGRGREKPKSS